MNKEYFLKNDPHSFDSGLRKRVEASMKPERIQSDDPKKTHIKRMALIPVTGVWKKYQNWKYTHNKDPKMK
jgi:hypothetical protein